MREILSLSVFALCSLATATASGPYAYHWLLLLPSLVAAWFFGAMIGSFFMLANFGVLLPAWIGRWGDGAPQAVTADALLTGFSLVAFVMIGAALHATEKKRRQAQRAWMTGFVETESNPLRPLERLPRALQALFPDTRSRTLKRPLYGDAPVLRATYLSHHLLLPLPAEATSGDRNRRKERTLILQREAPFTPDDLEAATVAQEIFCQAEGRAAAWRALRTTRERLARLMDEGGLSLLRLGQSGLVVEHLSAHLCNKGDAEQLLDLLRDILEPFPAERDFLFRFRGRSWEAVRLQSSDEEFLLISPAPEAKQLVTEAVLWEAAFSLYAHEVKTVLTTLLCAVEDETHPGSPAHRDLIRTEAERLRAFFASNPFHPITSGRREKTTLRDLHAELSRLLAGLLPTTAPPPAGPDLELILDRDALSRLLQNLAQNAVAHSRSHRAELRLSLESNVLLIALTFHGPESPRPFDFEPLLSVAADVVRSSGLGLGLTCALLYLKRLGARLSSRPEADRFVQEIRLPLNEGGGQ